MGSTADNFAQRERTASKHDRATTHGNYPVHGSDGNAPRNCIGGLRTALDDAWQPHGIKPTSTRRRAPAKHDGSEGGSRHTSDESKPSASDGKCNDCCPQPGRDEEYVAL